MVSSVFSDPVTTPASHHLDQTVGVVFSGYVLTMILYGFIFFQMYKYFNTYTKDSWTSKGTVAILTALDSAGVAVLTQTVHHYIITLFPLPTVGIDDATKSYCADFGLAAISVFIVQLYYTHRLWDVTKNVFIIVVAATCSIVGLALGLVMTGRISQNPSFDLFGVNPSKAINAVGQGLVLLMSIITFCVLSVHLPKAGSRDRGGYQALDNFLEYAISRGGAAMLVQLGFFISFLVAPRQRYWMLFHLVARRLFIVSCLSMLNSREIVKGKGVYDEQTLLWNADVKGSQQSRSDITSGTTNSRVIPVHLNINHNTSSNANRSTGTTDPDDEYEINKRLPSHQEASKDVKRNSFNDNVDDS